MMLITLAITAHWINDNWELEEALLEFKHQPGRHTGDILGDEIFAIIQKFGIAEKLFCITTDNADNNKTLMKRLSQKLRNELGICWDPAKHHIRCLNHVINLAVQDFLKSIKGLVSLDDDSDDDNSANNSDDNAHGDVEEDFGSVIHKIRTIAKVYKRNIQM
jgi:hypothetical protein